MDAIAVTDNLRLAQVMARYAVAITPHLEALIDTGDPNDPIARQFLPDARELDASPEERADPIGDGAHSPVPGIVHRHRDRVLLKPVHVCPVYCRFCFRREMVGPGKMPALDEAGLEAALGYIESHDEIWEVILTGGDPFLLSPRRARRITERLAASGHVKIVRWHTRVPVADPSRVTADFVRALMDERVATYIAIHVNHPRELTLQTLAACKSLRQAGATLVSQSVLLKGINDDIDTLEALMRALVEGGIKPYYLHHGDLAPGTAHFRTPIARGRALMRELRARASGLCQPTYVLDIPGGHGKVPLEAENVDMEGRVRDHAGCWQAYPPSTSACDVTVRRENCLPPRS